MTSSTDTISDYLIKIHGGGTELIDEFLTLLADKLLFAALNSFEIHADARGTNTIKLASYLREGKTVIPAFTLDTSFFEWSQGAHQCFSVAASDLALSLPPNTLIEIAPDSEMSVLLDSSQVKKLASFSLGGEESIEPAIERREKSDKVVSSILAAIGTNENVLEAYYQESDVGSARGVLGLLTSGLDVDARFTLIDCIAEISREHYGTAGAIEVYDDLDVISSSSWELFRTLPPFFSRGQEAEKLDIGEIEIEKLEEEDDGAEKVWGDIKKRSSKLLGVISGSSD